MDPEALPELEADLRNEWAAHGLPAANAKALIDALAGLTAQDRVNPDALQTSLRAYNAAVEAASPAFVADPPASFLALRHALEALTVEVP